METITVYRNASDGCFSYMVARGGMITERMHSQMEDYSDFSFWALVTMGRKLPPLKWMKKVDDATWRVVRNV